MSAKASQNAAESPVSRATARKEADCVRTPERPVQRPTASERPIDRFARLMADIRRTHPVTALMLSAEYVRCARADREAWLARGCPLGGMPGLEAEWGA
jgi:hypothetical protein